MARERRRTFLDLRPEGSCGIGVCLAEKHQAFSRLLLCAGAFCAWSKPLTEDEEVESSLQQAHDEAGPWLWTDTADALDVGPGLEEWAEVCPGGLAVGTAVLKQRPRSTLWKARLNSWLKHG